MSCYNLRSWIAATLLSILTGQQVAAGLASATATSQPLPQSPMHWVAREGAPVSVRHFLDSVQEQRDAYISSILSDIGSLKSQIDQLKQQRGAASKTQVAWRNVGGGESEADGNAYAAEEHQGMLISAHIEQKWKEIHGEEAKIDEASNPLWLPPPGAEGNASDAGAEPLPANYMDYLVQGPVGAGPVSPGVPKPAAPVRNGESNCLTLDSPSATTTGAAQVQVLAQGVPGTGLTLRFVGDSYKCDSDDVTHLTIKSQRRSLALGELKMTPIARLWLDGGNLNLQWLHRDAEPGATKALGFAILETEDAGGAAVSTWRFTPRMDAALNVGHSGQTKLSLDPAIYKAMSWKVDAIPPVWTLQKPDTTALASGGYITFTLVAKGASLHISYDAANASVVIDRRDDLQQQYDSLRQKQTQGDTVEVEEELQTVRGQLDADHQLWRTLSACIATIVLPNGLDVARFSFETEPATGSSDSGIFGNPSLTGGN
jgi:hypothetical protein